MKRTEIIIREGTLLDAKPVKLLAFSIMKSLGIKPETNGIYFEIGQLGEDYSGSIDQLVACKEDIIIGSVILREKMQNIGKLSGFYVNSEYRGLGVGKLLLKEVINRAKGVDLDGIYLETLDKLKIAIHIYKKLGWEQVTESSINSEAERIYYLNLKQNQNIIRGLIE